MTKKNSLRDLARLAGCSAMTVSMALRHSPRITPATSERIRLLASEHGYTPDENVANLMRQLRSPRHLREIELLGLLVWKNENEEFDSKYDEGIRLRADKLGYKIERILVPKAGITARKLSRMLSANSIRGVILAPLPQSDISVSLPWETLATSTIGYALADPDPHRVSASHYQEMILALRHLKRLGYKKAGYLTLRSQESLSNGRWLAAYLAYQYRVNGAIQIPPLLISELVVDIVQKWVRKNKLDVIIGDHSPTVAMLREHPAFRAQPVGIVSLVRREEEQDTAGIEQRHELIGAGAVDLVVEQIENREFGLPIAPKLVLVEGTWIDGATAPKI